MISIYKQLMSATPVPSPESLRIPIGAQDTRMFGGFDSRMPAPYSGPYGILLGNEEAIGCFSIATDNAQYCAIVEPAEGRGELV